MGRMVLRMMLMLSWRQLRAALLLLSPSKDMNEHMRRGRLRGGGSRHTTRGATTVSDDISQTKKTTCREVLWGRGKMAVLP
mmetsp:Transcript_105112/g.169318  ORF Transcript_105112/g.169318 Transcript_105112/m.169318 type:complete len:81 (+) Transcript_105112:628-870(+)